MTSHQETSDAYERVLAASGGWRVIRCRDDIQFIIQKRRAGAAEWPWKASAYIKNPTALPTVLQWPSMGIPTEDSASIIAGVSK